MIIKILIGVVSLVLLSVGLRIYFKRRRRLAQNNRIYVVDKSTEGKPQLRICFSNKTEGSTLKVFSPFYNRIIKVKLEGRDYVYRG